MVKVPNPGKNYPGFQTTEVQYEMAVVTCCLYHTLCAVQHIKLLDFSELPWLLIYGPETLISPFSHSLLIFSVS